MNRMERIDWNEVVEMNPHGYAEFQNQEEEVVIHGPVESVIIDENDDVIIKLKWAVKMGLLGTPTFGKWKFAPNKKEITFPNFVVQFTIQDVPKGRRLLFGVCQIMYLETQSSLDTSKIKGFPKEEETK